MCHQGVGVNESVCYFVHRFWWCVFVIFTWSKNKIKSTIPQQWSKMFKPRMTQCFRVLHFWDWFSSLIIGSLSETAFNSSFIKFIFSKILISYFRHEFKAHQSYFLFVKSSSPNSLKATSIESVFCTMKIFENFIQMIGVNILINIIRDIKLGSWCNYTFQFSKKVSYRRFLQGQYLSNGTLRSIACII